MESTNGTYLAIVKDMEFNVADQKLQVDGKVVDLSDCPSLQIKVQSDEVTQADDIYGFPSYGNPKEYPEITKGKEGGAS